MIVIFILWKINQKANTFLNIILDLYKIKARELSYAWKFNFTQKSLSAHT